MNISVVDEQAGVPVTVIATHGDIDASNYLELVERAKQAYQAGARNILLDLSDTLFLSSSGLVALHSISLLLRGEKPIDPENGWEALHNLGESRHQGLQQHIKLLNPQPRVDRTLERSGLKEYFAIFTSREEALASFRAEGTQASRA